MLVEILPWWGCAAAWGDGAQTEGLSVGRDTNSSDFRLQQHKYLIINSRGKLTYKGRFSLLYFWHPESVVFSTQVG